MRQPCETRDNLFREWQEAVGRYSKSVAALTGQIGPTQEPQYSKLKSEAEVARTTMLQLHGQLYVCAGRHVHRRVEEPDVLAQHLLRAIRRRVVLVLGTMDAVVAVAGRGQRRRRNRDAIAQAR